MRLSAISAWYNINCSALRNMRIIFILSVYSIIYGTKSYAHGSILNVIMVAYLFLYPSILLCSGYFLLRKLLLVFSFLFKYSVLLSGIFLKKWLKLLFLSQLYFHPSVILCIDYIYGMILKIETCSLQDTDDLKENYNSIRLPLGANIIRTNIS